MTQWRQFRDTPIRSVIDRAILPTAPEAAATIRSGAPWGCLGRSFAERRSVTGTSGGQGALREVLQQRYPDLGRDDTVTWADLL
jgi:hypothetical protein